MSAYVCHPANVDTLVAIANEDTIMATAAKIYPHSTFDGIEEARNLVARYLVSMNVRSVQYRYDGESPETLPGHVFDAWTTATTYRPMPADEAYTHKGTELSRNYLNLRGFMHGPYGTGEAQGEFVGVCRRILGVSRAYEYQSCELPEWRTSPAAEFVREVESQVAGDLAEGWSLDGYKETALEAVLA